MLTRTSKRLSTFARRGKGRSRPSWRGNLPGLQCIYGTTFAFTAGKSQPLVTRSSRLVKSKDRCRRQPAFGVFIGSAQMVTFPYLHRNRQRELRRPRNASVRSERGRQLLKRRNPSLRVPVWLRADWREDNLLSRQQSVVCKYPHVYL